MQHLFRYRADEKLGMQNLLRILKPDFEPVGHHRRASEEIVMSNFIAFLWSIEGIVIELNMATCMFNFKISTLNWPNLFPLLITF